MQKITTAILIMLLSLPLQARENKPTKEQLFGLLQQMVRVRQYAQMIQADSAASKLTSMEKRIGDEILNIMRDEIRQEFKNKKEKNKTRQ